MELNPVKSSNIKAVGHKDGYLYVQFNSGATWKYSAVPESIYKEMIGSESIGSYFGKNIKPNHHGQKVEG